MASQIQKTARLLAPYARPRLKALLLVFLMGTVTAAAQSSVLLLIEPLFNLVLFEKPVDATAAGPPARAATEEQAATGGAPAAGERAAGAGPEQGGEGPLASLPVPGKTVTEGLHLPERLALRWRDHALANGTFEDGRIAVLLGIVAAAALLALLGGVSQYVFTWLARRTSYHMIVDLRVDLARHLMGLSMRYHNQRRFGDLLSRLSSDVTTTLGAVNVALKSLVLEPLFAVTTFLGMLYVAPVPTLVVAAVMPIALLPVSRFTRRVRRGSKKSLTSLGASVQVLTQMFQGVRTVKSFGGETRELARYRETNEKYLRTSMKMVRAIAFMHSWTAFYSIAGVAVLVLALGLIQIHLSAFANEGIMTTLFVLIVRFNNHVKSATKALTGVEESVGASERILEVLDEEADVVERPDAAPCEGIAGGIRFEGVSFTYPGSDAPALEGVDLELQPGETLAVVGPSGAGKSTLMDLLARFIEPTAGRITVGGRDLRDLTLASWTAQYAMVGQVPFLFHATIGENIRYGEPGATQDAVEAAARAADVHDFIASLPQGYETDVADMGARLSGGQRQRITIARALLKGAPLLLLDEATSALDSESEKEVQRALDRLMEDRTVLVIAHRLSTIRDADRIVVLEGGRVAEVGTHEELVGAGGVYARLVALQRFDDRVPSGAPPVLTPEETGA